MQSLDIKARNNICVELCEDLQHLASESDCRLIYTHLHEIIIYLTSGIKNAGCYTERIVEFPYQTELRGVPVQISTQPSSRRQLLDPPKWKIILSRLSRFRGDVKFEIPESVINKRTASEYLKLPHRLIKYYHDPMDANVIAECVELIESIPSIKKYEIKVDFSPFIECVANNNITSTITSDVILPMLTAAPFRQVAYDARHAGKNVYVVSHGALSVDAIDEPIFSYAYPREFHVVDYGTFNIDERPVKFERLSDSSARCIRNNKAGYNRPKNRYIYLPTSLSKYRTYGPYRDIPDGKYLDHWKELSLIFPDMDVKVHPKQKFGIESDLNIITGDLTKVLQNYEYAVFDYVSTALMQAIDMGIKIIFVDIGIRNLHEEFLKDLKLITFYVDFRTGYDGRCISELLLKEIRPEQRRNFLQKYSGNSLRFSRSILTHRAMQCIN